MCKSEIMPPVFFFSPTRCDPLCVDKKNPKKQDKYFHSIKLSNFIGFYQRIKILYLDITLFSDHWNFPKE